MPARTPPPSRPERPHGSERSWAGGLREAGPYLGLGLTLAVTVLLGLGGGYWLDERLGTRPLLLLAGGTIGLGAGLYHFIKTVAGLQKR